MFRRPVSGVYPPPGAVERTVPFDLYTQSIASICTTSPATTTRSRCATAATAPRYTTSDAPSYQDMIVELRRVLIAAQYQPEVPDQPTHEEIRAVPLAWARAAA